MLSNYIKTAFRSMKRYKAYTAINIIGLTLGLAAGLALFAYVADDLGWDGFHENKNRIFLLTQKESYGGADMEFTSMVVPPLAPVLTEEIPEIEATARFGIRGRLVIQKDNEKFDERNCCFADPEFLKIFSFPMIYGDPETALSRPDAILLRQEVAQRHFGKKNPVGETLLWGEGRTSIITGVYSIPENASHLEFNALSPISSVIAEGRRMDNWEQGYVTSYILLRPLVDPQVVSEKITGILDKNLGRESSTEFSLLPLKDLHLRANHIRTSWNAGQGNILYTLSLGAIGLFLLIIVCINYTNLATARCLPRSREIGLRKVIGAKKRDLRLQFISESVVTALFAAVLAVTLVEVAKPWLSSVAGRPIHLNLTQPATILGILALTVVVGILSGIYPAFILSAYKPNDVLRRAVFGRSQGLWFRRGLVVFQFILSVFLIFGVGAITRQIHYMLTKDLGFNPDQVLFVQISGIPTAYGHRLAMQETFLEVPGVEAVGLSGSLPGMTYARSNIVPEGAAENWAMDMVIVDEACLDVYQFRLVQGRFFSKDFPSDRDWDSGQGAIVLNRTAVQRLGWEDPLGRKITLSDLGCVGTVIGIVEDFHNQSLHQPIEPIILANLGWDAFLNVRLGASGITETLAGLERTWKEFVPDAPFSARFIDEEFGNLYAGEKRIGTLAGIFSALAVFIAALGVLGLTSFSTERRNKEIGIRKVLGASASQIIYLISKEFIFCVLIANFVAWPLGFILVNQWLQGFAYRTNIGILVFFISLLITLAVALATAGTLSFRAASANPVQSLRYE